MRMYPIAFAVSILVAGWWLGGVGADGAEIPAIGAHHPIVVVQKNVNPQNVMVIYTQLDAKGGFQSDPAKADRPVFDFYWLMDGKSYKPVHRLIKKEIGRRFECEMGEDDRATRFVVHMNDLKEVDSDIKEPKMEVLVRGTGAGRTVEAQMNLGPSDGNMRIKLLSIYTEGNAFPPTVSAVTLKGEEIVKGKLTGRKVERRYAGK